MAKKQSSHYHTLKNKWSKHHDELKKSIWNKHKDSLQSLQLTSKQLMAGSLASLMLVSQSATTPALAQQLLPKPTPAEEHPNKTPQQLVKDLATKLPDPITPLDPIQKTEIAQVLSDYFHVRAISNLQGIELNRAYGIIGAEQHLMRYPGDTLTTHFSTEAEKTQFARNGMAPGKGAWGYFTNSQSSLTQTDIDREKYYIAVQTFLSPGWSNNTKKLYTFFKYQKMLVVNPENGKAIVAVIGDAGPAKFTGKHLGGSPEVMEYLERQDGGAKGPVLYYFLDDPDNLIPLGPRTI